MSLSKFFTKEKITELHERYERKVTSAGFVFGFVVDNLTLKRIDLLFENAVLFSYIMVAGASIAVFNLWESGRIRGRAADMVAPWLPLVMQIAFGALFSGYVVFYTRSGSFFTSWPFLLMLAVLLVGNEFFRKRYQQLVFQISIFYIAVFSFLIFFLPVVFKTLGAGMFLLSGVASVFVVIVFTYMLFHAFPVRMREQWRMVAISVGSIYVVLNVLYFTNSIPPIPLSLKEAGAYHTVIRRGDGYVATAEKQSWYAFLQPYTVLHINSASPVSVFSAVFAPTELATTIVHEWQYFDEDRDQWVGRGRVSFPIVGGRDGGYRGYSTKTGVEPGWWRVEVETSRGQVLGRAKFRIVETKTVPERFEQVL